MYERNGQLKEEVIMEVRGGQGGRMPIHLRVVIGLMCLSVLLRIAVSVIYVPIAHSMRWTGDIFAIVLAIALIRGLLSRSLIALYVSRAINIVGLALLATSLLAWFFYAPVLSLSALWFPIPIAIQAYFLWALFSRDVKLYFTRSTALRDQ
jgi:hypothetical protein